MVQYVLKWNQMICHSTYRTDREKNPKIGIVVLEYYFSTFGPVLDNIFKTIFENLV